MSASASVVIPVQDGARYLAEVLAARARAGAGPRGARDRLRLARRLAGDRARGRRRGAGDRAGRVRARAHAQPRRRAHQRRADLLPHPGRDAAAGLARRLPRGVRARRRRRRGVRPAPAAAGHVADDRARADRVLRRLLARRRARRSSAAGDRPFLSNVNACYRRACWEQIRFDDVPLLRGPGVRPGDAAPGWRRRYHPGAAVLHAHDYSPVGFMRRYFDEYRGLRETAGHVERIGVRSTLRDVRGLVGADRRWMREQGVAGARAARAGPAASAAAPLGPQGRSPRSARARTGCPAPVQRAISLEGRRRDGGAGPPRPSRPCPQPARGAEVLSATSRASSRDGRGAAARPGAGHGGRRAAAHRGRDPALPARQRRALDDLQPAHAAGGARAHRHDLAARPGGAPP